MTDLTYRVEVDAVTLLSMTAAKQRAWWDAQETLAAAACEALVAQDRRARRNTTREANKSKMKAGKPITMPVGEP